MSLISIQFLLFVLFGMLCYYLAPDRHKWKLLLIFSVSYYLIICNKYILYMLVTVLTTYFGTRKIEQIYGQMHCTIKENKGIWEREQRVAYKKGMETRARRTMILVLLLNFGILGVVKYAGFVTDIFVGLCNAFGMQLESPEFHFLLPLGISFYTFQSMGYVIDVYQEKIPAERNLGKVALFVSFFPQIIQGPIAMYDHLARQLYEPHSFDWERTKKAGLLILWGLFKKLVIADRAVLFINYITADSSQFRGTFILIAVLLYALQLYADFSGGIDVVRGIGELFGITMAENFRRPYFSLSLTEYWHRWHITLGNWVRNYVFYPLSISKGFINMGKWMSKHWSRHFGKVVPTSLASVITFLIIGIWHGANGKYVAFGLWNGLVIMVIELLQPVTDKVKKCLHVKEESKVFHLVCMVWTFLLVLVGYYFDVANNFKDAMQMMYRSVTDVHLADLSHFSDVLLKCGLDFADFRLLLFSAGVLFVVSCVQEKKNLELREWILSRRTFFRWGIVYVCMFFVLVFGFYGFGINPADFIYTQF